jgi:5'-nucleotidase (lipoprotein e(P4) family)
MAGLYYFKTFIMKRTVLIILISVMVQLVKAQDSLKAPSAEDLKLYPVLWQQSAAEYRALCYQAFNIAQLRLDGILKEKQGTRNLAIITDLDETILDNSDLEAEIIKAGAEINNGKWLKWINKPTIPTVPGAVDFLQDAGRKGVTIFYISNRDTSGLKITLSILQKLKLPDADLSHMLFLSGTASKEPRRQAVMKDNDVVMLLGDNLNDFLQVFEGKPINGRLTETSAVKEEWGKKFIVLPNATYGDWESALFGYKEDLTDAQKIAMLKSLLRGLDDQPKK